MTAGLFLCLGVHLNGLGALAQTTGHGVAGLWRTEDGVSVVEISRCGASLCGCLLSFPPVIGDPKTNAGLCNLQILGGFGQDDDRRWVDRWIVDPEEEQAYRAGPTPDGMDALDVRIGDGLVGESLVWRRQATADVRCTLAR